MQEKLEICYLQHFVAFFHYEQNTFCSNCMVIYVQGPGIPEKCHLQFLKWFNQGETTDKTGKTGKTGVLPKFSSLP